MWLGCLFVGLPGSAGPAQWGVFWQDEGEEAWHVTETLLGTLDQEVARAAGKLIVFVIPSRFQVLDGDWAALRQAQGLSEAEGDRERPNQGIRQGRTLRCVDAL